MKLHSEVKMKLLHSALLAFVKMLKDEVRYSCRRLEKWIGRERHGGRLR